MFNGLQGQPHANSRAVPDRTAVWPCTPGDPTGLRVGPRERERGVSGRGSGASTYHTDDSTGIVINSP